jgi:sporulation protein YlmC with PRC-barrel domain
MNKFKFTSLVCGGLVSLALPVLAQQSATQSGSSGFNKSENSGAYGSSATGQQWGQKAHGVRLSSLLNSQVQSKDGKTLGTLRDITVDPQSGHIQFGILSLSSAESGAGTSSTSTSSTTTQSSHSSLAGTPNAGGYPNAELTGKLIPVPWQLFSQSWSASRMGSTETQGAAGQHQLVLNIDESKLQSAPSFEASNWSELHQSSFDQQVYSYFGVNRMTGAGTAGSSTEQGTGTYPGARGGAEKLEK